MTVKPVTKNILIVAYGILSFVYMFVYLFSSLNPSLMDKFFRPLWNLTDEVFLSFLFRAVNVLYISAIFPGMVIAFLLLLAFSIAFNVSVAVFQLLMWIVRLGPIEAIGLAASLCWILVIALHRQILRLFKTIMTYFRSPMQLENLRSDYGRRTIIRRPEPITSQFIPGQRTVLFLYYPGQFTLSRFPSLHPNILVFLALIGYGIYQLAEHWPDSFGGHSRPVTRETPVEMARETTDRTNHHDAAAGRTPPPSKPVSRKRSLSIHDFLRGKRT